jgi:hypothetical protein
LDPQVASIRRFVVWAVVWALTLTLLGGLFIWMSPIRAAGDALPTPTPISTQIQTTPPAPAAVMEPTAVTENILYFPLMFNRGDPYISPIGLTP